MIALLEAHRAGLLSRSHWVPNIVAGLVVGVVALPLAMAFAIASGARPEQGIYTAIVGGGLISILGGSRLQIAGPTGAFIVILAGVTAKFGIAGLQLATLMAGVMLLLMGIVRMGGAIRFIPPPVVVGFTAGIAVIIFFGQWSAFLGLPQAEGAHFHQKLLHQLRSLTDSHLPTLCLSLLSLMLVWFAPKLRWLARVPGPLTAMLVVSLLQAWLHLPGVATIGSTFGGIPTGLPTFTLPE
ncbi:MAG: sulfate permease, partial [Pseudomonadota bacterium]